jgi:dihydrolipoamide dehydrogenase
MAENVEVEVAVLGAGPGGYAAAFLAADLGMQVALLDASPKPGGVCLLCGCIPSKALLHAAKIITEAHEANTWGIHFQPPKIDVSALRARKDKIVDTMSTNLAELAKRRKVKYVQGRATFENSTTLKLDNGGTVKYKHCILASGSSPARPPALNLDSPRVLDSTGALKLEKIPASLLVVGGGYIGLEMGTVYAALGSKVTVVELTPSLLPGVDADLVRPLHARLKPLFENIYLNTKVVKFAEEANGIRATLEGEEVKDKQPLFERVLVAVGRRPNSRDLGLERTKVQIDERGFVKVDAQRRSDDPNIFAIGDVAGEPMLAHKASHEGRTAVEVIAGENAAFAPRAIPAVVFTDPEVAWAGLTEARAAADHRAVAIAKFPWGASGRAISIDRPDGLTKLVLDPDSGQILGVGLVGAGAGELISEGVLAIEMGANATDLKLSIHPHPTLTETVMESAEAFFGEATHIYRPKRPTPSK